MATKSKNGKKATMPICPLYDKYNAEMYKQCVCFASLPPETVDSSVADL